MRALGAQTYLILDLVLLTRLAISCPGPNETYINADDVLLSKRWFGIGNAAIGEPWTVNAWPVVPNDDASVPQDHDPTLAFQPLRYCYESQEVHDLFRLHVDLAIELWQPAMDVSAMAIVGDTGSPDALCEYASKDTLHLLGGARTSSTVGWDDRRKRGQTRMTLNMALMKKVPKDHVLPRYMVSIAHEFGHALGLSHEHSRPDREDSVWLYCENLKDYEKVKQKLTAGRTMEEACTHYEFAQWLGFSAASYLPGPYTRLHSIGQKVWSTSYDVLSIMHYDSFANSGYDIKNYVVDGTGTATKSNAVMLKVKPGSTKGDKQGDVIWRGGVQDPEDVKISEGDIARIAQLYPKYGGWGIGPALEEKWEGTSFGFEMGKRMEATATSLRERTAVPVV